MAPSLAIIFFLWKAGIIKFSGENTKSETREEKIQETLEYLKLHFNDELTKVLTEIRVDQRESRETQLQQCGKLEEIRDSLREIVRNGVRIKQ